jgi:23S rRNA (cytosine1962-C5)-methyltransferase
MSALPATYVLELLHQIVKIEQRMCTNMWTVADWDTYALLDAGDGQRLERWGDTIVARPDPQALWPRDAHVPWNTAHATYVRHEKNGGTWNVHTPLPERWAISYKKYTFWIRPTSFKHMGLFPEQATNWNWLHDVIAHRPLSLLHLFAYTGGATVASARAGAHVTHVDASKNAIKWAKENATLSHVPPSSVRWIVDDVHDFVRREHRRGNTYDGIIMDPPAYGRGPKGELWKLDTHLYTLIDACTAIVAPKPQLFVVNTYTSGVSPHAIANVVHKTMTRRYGGSIDCSEIGIRMHSNGLILPAGGTCRWVCD